MPRTPSNKQYVEILNRTKVRKNVLKGPLRALRLCILCILGPAFLIAVPLYLRYNVYAEQRYPLGFSDMRLVDTSVSTTWCQKQIIRANGTFNAYLLSDQPDTKRDPVYINMTRTLVLSNDMKEYWGYYLLKDSIVTVSSCVRWPGASMVMIKGHKHLKECAYLGDNSSEEKSEQDGLDESDEVEDANKPETMVKMQEGVKVAKWNTTWNDTHDSSNSEKFNIDTLPIKTKGGKNIHLNYAEDIRNQILRGSHKNHLHHVGQEDTTEKPKVLTSSETFDEILKKLKKMGDRGTKILEQLNLELINKTESGNAKNIQKKLDAILKVTSSTPQRDQHLLEIVNKTDNEGRRNGSSSDEINLRQKRRDRSSKKRARDPEVVDRIKRELKVDNEEENVATEAGVPLHFRRKDGIAEIRGTVNETSPNDNSKSEFWSSFSSSEERLMECEGLLLNLPLSPHKHCVPTYENDDVLESNTVSYKIPSNGYYFFIFNSENEVQTNYLKIKFELQRIMYNVSEAVVSCENETNMCSFPLDFFSKQKVVLEIPYIKNETSQNEEFLATSVCEPRTSIYLICVIAVPVLIIMFAFQ